ncbi:hypothetical protein B0H17DRAFT_1082247 [Mycena rosella]|uniref:Inositol oxygenase n=1 Tax=Mycena rosella TaxID=1033263 RepID=A0AAD7D1V3_MYCRO|nr:hypothetical protein B0H17DRAFT_1082247 [Mycena rosella]
MPRRTRRSSASPKPPAIGSRTSTRSSMRNRRWSSTSRCGSLFSPLYHILKEQSSLPEEGLWMIRYHSFYPCAALPTPSSSPHRAPVQVAPRRSIYAPHRARGRARARRRTRVQSVRPLLEERRRRRRRGTATVLPGPHRQVFPRRYTLVSDRSVGGGDRTHLRCRWAAIKEPFVYT